MSRYRHSRRGGLFGALIGAMALAIALLAGAAITGGTRNALAADDPSQINFTLEACRNDGNPAIILPNGSGQFICPDGAYTTGNLGKAWSELDLVPHRVTLVNNNGTQTYTFIVAGDYKNGSGTGTGWDVISALTLNAAKSSASCPVSPTMGPLTITAPGGGVGGADQTIYRTVTLTQQADATCVYDYYQRLALGAHNFSGSSLQSNLWNQELKSTGIGQKRLSLPVGEILPQELSKDMSASQGTDHVWNISKSATPAHVDFGDTCDANAPKSAAVSITIQWVKQPATPGGSITIVTHVYAKNPASRTITVNVTDVIRSGSTTLDTATSGPIDVPANTTLMVLEHTTTVPAGTTNLNDIATATYTDKVTGVPVPGNTTATASAIVQLSGPELNQSAVIKDAESITGADLSYSADSFSGVTGSFDNNYLPGTKTTGAVSWTSTSQGTSGSVTFQKTIYIDQASNTSGVLSDIATLLGSDGFTATPASAEIDIAASAKVKLTINKTIPNVLTGSETETFNFQVTGPSGTINRSITFVAGDTNESTTVEDLDPGVYTVAETGSASGKWNTQSNQSATINLPTCSGAVTFNNTFAAATAQVKKITVPAGGEAGWEFVLNGPGANNVSVTTNGAGYIAFPTQLQEGSYTITEVSKAGYDQTGSSGDCAFSVNYPADAGRTFSCTYTNTQRGKIIVKKQTVPAGSSQSFSFTPSYGSSFSLSDGQSNTSGFLAPGSYSVSENVPAGWDLTSATCDDNSQPSAISLQPGEIVTCTFVNTQRGKIIVEKQTNPDGAAGSFSFSGTAFGSIGDNGTIEVNNLVPGTYTSTEADPTPNFDLTSVVCNDASSATPSSGSVGTRTATFRLDPGETVKCVFTNTQRGSVTVVKTVGGQAPSGSDAFTFQLRKDATAASNGTTLDTQIANANNGGSITFSVNGSTKLVPGTYQLCEFIQVGWKSSIQTMAGAFVPGQGGDTTADNTYVCVPFTLAAGQNATFNIDNTRPPGGMAKTIGFWKNWASCANSNGKQKPILDQTLAKAGSILIGDLSVDTCLEAVAILNKSTLNGKKMASDSAFNLAAQLLAYRLNIVAGAGDKPAANAAASQAQAYLDALNFDGLTHGPISKQLAATLNSLAATLDSYNNNTLP